MNISQSTCGNNVFESILALIGVSLFIMARIARTTADSENELFDKCGSSAE
jgi:hypothetical protein